MVLACCMNLLADSVCQLLAALVMRWQKQLSAYLGSSKGTAYFVYLVHVKIGGH